MATYLEKLKDPRWQKRRLEIMDRDNFQCCNCKSKTEELNVHHLYYEKDKEPWDAEDKYLITFCSSCHELRHYREDSFKRLCAEFNNNNILDEVLSILIQISGNNHWEIHCLSDIIKNIKQIK